MCGFVASPLQVLVAATGLSTFSPLAAVARPPTASGSAAVFAVESAALDPRSYRALVLPSGLRVLLASDPQSLKAAAAMNVQVATREPPVHTVLRVTFHRVMPLVERERVQEE